MTNGCPKSVTHHQDIFSSECQFLCYGLLGKWPIYQCLVNFGQVCIIAIFNFLFVYRRFCLKFCLQQVKCIPSQFQFWSVNRQNDYGLTANPKAQPPPPPTPLRKHHRCLGGIFVFLSYCQLMQHPVLMDFSSLDRVLLYTSQDIKYA